MATTTELARGYRFELAGSIQFPVPSEIYDDLGFADCPIFEPDVQSAAIGPSGEPPLLLHSDPDKLFEHLNERMGLDAVLGMAEIAAWADAPGPGHRSVRRAHAPQVARRDVRLRHQREGAPGHPHRHVRQRDGRHRPAPARPVSGTPRSAACWPSCRSTPPSAVPTPRAARSAWPSPWPPRRAPPCPRSRAASAPCRTTWPGCSRSTGASSGVTSRWPGSPPRPVGWSASASPTARRSAHRSSCRTSTRPPPSPNSSTATSCPTSSSSGSTPSTTGPPTSRCTSPSTACPSTPAPTRSSTRVGSATT